LTTVALAAPEVAATKVRLWTAGEANWRAKGERRALEKDLDAIFAMCLWKLGVEICLEVMSRW
jgi:hypothetical protein